LDPEDIRDAKLKVLRQVDRVDVEHKVVAGQYVAHEGKLGYKDNPNVAADSRAPTFAMLVLNIRNERWDGVPFILKAGKALNEKRSEIRIQLRQTPGDIFGDLEKPGDPTDPAVANGYAGPNEFVLRLQPHEEMYMKLTIKEPGLGVQPVPSEMELSGRWRAEQLRKEAAGEAPRRAYERLLLDAVHGHQAHFVRGDELEAAWQIVDPVNDAIESGRVPLHEYPFGTRGPSEADALRKASGHVAFVVPRDGVHLSSADDLASYDFSPKYGSIPAGDVWGRAADTGPGLMPPTRPA
jgi:glucose-6-phosphate 1-dehydrogenase